MNKSRKKSLLLAVSITLVIILLIGGTVAWLTDTRRIENKLGIGLDTDGKKLVSLDLYEDDYVSNLLGAVTPPADLTELKTHTDLGGGKWLVKGDNGSVTYEILSEDTGKFVVIATDNPELMPGDEIKKDPTIEITGSKPVYLRARAYIRLNDGAGNKTSHDAFTHEYTGPNGLGLLIGDSSKWEKKGNEHWYYYNVTGTTQTAVDSTAGLINFFLKGDAGGTRKGADGQSNWAADSTLMVPTKWTGTEIDKIYELGGLTIVVEAQVIQADNVTPDMADASGDPWLGYAPDFTATLG